MAASGRPWQIISLVLVTGDRVELIRVGLVERAEVEASLELELFNPLRELLRMSTHHLELLVSLVDAARALRLEHLLHERAERKLLPSKLLSAGPAQRPCAAATDQPKRASCPEEDVEALELREGRLLGQVGIELPQEGERWEEVRLGRASIRTHERIDVPAS